MNDELNRIIARLEEAATSLNDLAMAILHEAIDSGRTDRPEMEKRVSQARRAVDKAIRHLSGADGAVNDG